jgi:hypothetical protein
MIRDDVDVPPILVKCCEAIEKYGIEAMGIYRISGTLVKVNKLREKLDKGWIFSVIWREFPPR